MSYVRRKWCKHFVTVKWKLVCMFYVWASKYSWNHFISEKCKILQSHKPQFFLNSASVQWYTSVSNCKILENFLKVILWKPFQLFRRIFNDVSSITKTRSLQWRFKSREQVKIEMEPSEGNMGNPPVLSHFSLLRNSLPKAAGVLNKLCEQKKPTVDSLFFGTFLLNTHFETEISLVKQNLQIISSNYCNVNRDIRENFEAAVFITFLRWPQGILVKIIVLLK